MGSAGLSKEIKIADPLERRLVSDIAVAGMSSVAVRDTLRKPP
jgi:hypothetical protein